MRLRNVSIITILLCCLTPSYAIPIIHAFPVGHAGDMDRYYARRTPVINSHPKKPSKSVIHHPAPPRILDSELEYQLRTAQQEIERLKTENAGLKQQIYEQPPQNVTATPDASAPRASQLMKLRNSNTSLSNLQALMDNQKEKK